MKFERDDAKIGLLVFAALAIFTGLILHRSVSAVVKREIDFQVHLDNVSDLSEGTEVQLQGMRVGQVRQIRLERSGVNYGFTATFGLRPDLVLWKGTRAAIASRGLGSAFLDLQLPPENQRTEVLPENAILPGIQGASIGSVVEVAHALLNNLNQSVDDLRVQFKERGAGVVLDHPQMRKVLTDLDRTILEFHKTASESTLLAKQGSTTLQSMDRSIASLEKSTITLQTILEKRTEDVNAILVNLSAVLKEVQALGSEIRTLLKGTGPEVDSSIKALHRNLQSTEELLELLKAKPNRIVWGTPSTAEKEAARQKAEAKQKTNALPPKTPKQN